MIQNIQPYSSVPASQSQVNPFNGTPVQGQQNGPMAYTRPLIDRNPYLPNMWTAPAYNPMVAIVKTAVNAIVRVVTRVVSLFIGGNSAAAGASATNTGAVNVVPGQKPVASSPLSLLGQIPEQIGRLAQNGQDLWSTLKETGSKLWDIGKELIGPVLSIFGGPIGGVIGKGLGLLKGGFGKVGGLISKGFNLIKSIF
ncbi:MAG: hypothetical protein D6719_11675 [Candidatus Dadabacteria bacterium]|nr:MAG: hypothetical protein D6719_11675 [Candidatus Dadabacteria bacterium]